MRKTSIIPSRITWAVNQLRVRPDQRILEIGPGRGVAAELVCNRLSSGTGSYLGIDRPAFAVTASRERNRRHVERQTAQFEQLVLQEIDPNSAGSLHTVFAINVNLFWTKSDQLELGLIRTLLNTSGQLCLFFEAPTAGVMSRLADRLGEHLDHANFVYEVTSEDREGALLLGFRCSPHPLERLLLT